MKNETTWYIAILLVCAVCAGLFLWRAELFNFQVQIDSQKFSDFGSFVGGIFGTLSFIWLIFTLREAKTQSFDNSFYNHLAVHESVVRDLLVKGQHIKIINDEITTRLDKIPPESLTEEVRSEYHNYKNKPDANDYFEALYRMLHIQYKYENRTPDKYFKDYTWQIGHFLRSFTSVAELVFEATFSEEKKSFYSRVIKSRATDDELRLIFYFVIFNSNLQERSKLLRMSRALHLFENIKDSLIKSDDWKKYIEMS
ncbi:hypothetical protein KK062_10900 [Fulvivirgaceae bacterium PWU5]|uniref:Phage abortive infection protein n=1 Tax=Dawidia cretensis TaxID=2782350 RepID=A0AAP2DWK9_9BACT|nr:hypothetical protein [Dawidia cretensis]MBT1708736.1 hypothetical protein [Dawidia cretensis]